MIYKLGDQNINTKQVFAISDPIHDGLDFIVNIFFIGGTLKCKFDDTAEKYTHWVKGKGWLLKLIDDTEEESTTVNYNKYYRFKDSVIYKDMADEIKKLSDIIERND